METLNTNSLSLEQKKELFLECLKSCGGLISLACKKSRIVGRTQFYQWKKDDPEFARRVDEIIEDTVDYVESKLLAKVEKNETVAIIFYLKAKGKERGYK